jgi:signal transduction histidine kinase
LRQNLEAKNREKPKRGIYLVNKKKRSIKTKKSDCIDLTEKKHLPGRHNLENTLKERPEQLQQTQDKLVKSERLAAIGELAGMVGHDLRNPLTAIKNATYFIRKKLPPDSDETIKDMFKIIDNAILHADKIINDLLQYSREIQLELVECTPKSLLEEALSLIKVPCRVKIVDKTQKEPRFKADKNKIAMAFVNLLKNAIDAIPTIGNIKVKSAYNNGNVKISFADTGIGIPKEKLSTLFSPLITTKAQGMGFGLAICKRMVEAHQGRITVESTPGKGTTFTITLPLEPKLEKGAETTWVKLPESTLLNENRSA